VSVLVRDIACQQAIELATDYLEGALSSRERRRFEKHLANCPACTGYLQQLRATVAALGSAEPEDVEPETLQGLVELFERYQAEK
jgi:anti-sigma factor RsiW